MFAVARPQVSTLEAQAELELKKDIARREKNTLCDKAVDPEKRRIERARERGGEGGREGKRRRGERKRNKERSSE